MRLIDADKLENRKFAGLVHGDAEENTYRLGWNDAIDAIIDNAPTVEESPKGEWERIDKNNGDILPIGYKRLKDGTIVDTEVKNDLCESCRYGDTCERSDKGISFANHTVCWKYEEGDRQ